MIFQLKKDSLRKEIVTAKKAYSSSIENVEEKRTICRDTVRDVLLPLVVFHSRTERKTIFVRSNHSNTKLAFLLAVSYSPVAI